MTAAMKIKIFSPCKKSYDKLDSVLKSRDTILLTKVCIVKAIVFSSSHVWMWELDHNESWMLKNWCFWIVALDKIPESPLDSKVIKLINPKGNYPEYSLGGLMMKLQYVGYLMWKADSMEKTLMKGKIECRRKREWQRIDGFWHHWLNGHEFEQTLGNSEGQGSLACCSPWVKKNQTWLNNNNNPYT